MARRSVKRLGGVESRNSAADAVRVKYCLADAKETQSPGHTQKGTSNVIQPDEHSVAVLAQKIAESRAVSECPAR